MLSSKLKDNEKALFYLKKAFDFSPSFEIAKSLFLIYLRLDNPVEAIPFLNYAIQNNNSGLNLPLIKTYTEEIIQLEKKNEKGLNKCGRFKQNCKSLS